MSDPSIDLTVKHSSRWTVDFNDIPNHQSFVGVYDGSYGLYHKNFRQLIAISDTGIRMVTDDTERMSQVVVEAYFPVNLSISCTPSENRGRPRKKP